MSFIIRTVDTQVSGERSYSQSSLAQSQSSLAQLQPFRAFVLILFSTLLLFVATVMSPSPSQAHDQLSGTEGTVNEDGSGTNIRLSFTGNLQTIGAESLVLDEQGSDITAKPAEISGRDLIIHTKMPKIGETVTISWRVVSEDHHPIQARTAFAVVETNGVKTIEFREPAPVEQAVVPPVESASDSSSWSSILLWGVLGVVAIIVALTVFFVVLRRYRIRDSHPEQQEMKGATHAN